MRTLVTGAKGSIGSLLVPRLEGDVVATDVEELDVTEELPLRKLKRFDRIFHLAGAKHAPVGEQHPGDTFSVNVTGTENVLRWSQGAKVVMASTCKAANPETVYGASKLIAERMVLNAGGVVARFFNVRETSGNVFRLWEELPEDQPLPVTECYRYFISVEQAVYLLLACMELPSGRYAVEPGPPSYMPHEALRAYPGRPTVVVPPRRGDRVQEPIFSSCERSMPVEGYNGIFKIVSHHDL